MTLTTTVEFMGMKAKMLTLMERAPISVADMAFEIYGKTPKVTDPQNNVKVHLTAMRQMLDEAGDDRKIVRERTPGVRNSTYHVTRR